MCSVRDLCGSRPGDLKLNVRYKGMFRHCEFDADFWCSFHTVQCNDHIYKQKELQVEELSPPALDEQIYLTFYDLLQKNIVETAKTSVCEDPRVRWHNPDVVKATALHAAIAINVTVIVAHMGDLASTTMHPDPVASPEGFLKDPL